MINQLLKKHLLFSPFADIWQFIFPSSMNMLGFYKTISKKKTIKYVPAVALK